MDLSSAMHIKLTHITKYCKVLQELILQSIEQITPNPNCFL